MKTKVSVLLITIRYGGLEWQLQYLAQQTHPVDEFIVVDGCYECRHEEIMGLAKELGINLIHLREPKLSYHTFPNRCSNINFAIAHARNPLCVFIDDWHVFPSDFIETHVKLYNTGYAGVVRWVHTPFIDLSDYVSFVQAVEKCRPTMEDARRHYEQKQNQVPFTEERGRAWIELHEGEDERIKVLNRDTNSDVQGNIITDLPTDWWWPNSTSAPLKYLLAVNGFDEIFNGGTGGEDVDMATRMSRVGLKIAMDTRTTCYHVSHVSIPSRPPDKPICGRHDRAPFTYNEYCKGDPNLVENENLRTWRVDGIKGCKCKHCGWQGIVDSNEVLKVRRETEVIQASLESFGVKHTNLRELRASLGLPPESHVE